MFRCEYCGKWFYGKFMAEDCFKSHQTPLPLFFQNKSAKRLRKQNKNNMLSLGEKIMKATKNFTSEEEELIDRIYNGLDKKTTKKELREKILKKQEDLGFFVNKIASAHIIAKDLGVNLTITDLTGDKSTKGEKTMTDFELVGFINRKDGKISIKKDYRDDLEGLHNGGSNLLLKNLASLVETGKSEQGNDWYIIGQSPLNETDKGSGVFARRADSQKSVTFQLGSSFYTIPASSILGKPNKDGNVSDWIPISRIN